jgi:hypothetical protein
LTAGAGSDWFFQEGGCYTQWALQTTVSLWARLNRKSAIQGVIQEILPDDKR